MDVEGGNNVGESSVNPPLLPYLVALIPFRVPAPRTGCQDPAKEGHMHGLTANNTTY
jgi:hypothetical protein